MDRIVEQLITLQGKRVSLVISGVHSGIAVVQDIFPDDGHVTLKTDYGTTMLVRTDRIDSLLWEQRDGKSPQV